MIRLFISDLDGTLLNKWHISDRTINQGIQEIKKRGYQFAVATGRHLRYHQKIGLNFLKNVDYVISMNGALVTDKIGNIMVELPIESSIIEQLQLEFPSISFEFLTAQKTLVTSSRSEHFYKGFQGFLTTKNVARATLNMMLGRFNYQVSSEQIKNESILKIECITNSLEEKNRLIAYLDSNIDSLSYAYNDEVHFEITGKNVNKKSGIVQLLKMIEIHPDVVAVYGNDTNDVEMLRYFLHSYVPNNASEPAKQAAKNILDTTDEHSVIHHILETMRKQDSYRA